MVEEKAALAEFQLREQPVEMVVMADIRPRAPAVQEAQVVAPYLAMAAMVVLGVKVLTAPEALEAKAALVQTAKVALEALVVIQTTARVARVAWEGHHWDLRGHLEVAQMGLAPLGTLARRCRSRGKRRPPEDVDGQAI